MALAAYLQKTQRMLGDASFQRYNPYDLINYVNEARGQIAGEGECIRGNATISTAAGTEQYLHSALTGLPTGANAVVSIWSITYSAASPPLLLEGRPWEWFQLYYRTMGKTASSTPRAWSQYQQGTSGSFFIGPIPDAIYALSIDTVCEPTALSIDADPEAIPYPWTDAIPYYTAHLALRGEGMFEVADQMLTLYETYMNRARSSVTPQVLPGNFAGDWRSRGRGAIAAAPVVARGANDYPPAAGQTTQPRR